MDEDASDSEPQRSRQQPGGRVFRRRWNQHGSKGGVIHPEAGRGFLLEREGDHLGFRQIGSVMPQAVQVELGVTGSHLQRGLGMPVWR